MCDYGQEIEDIDDMAEWRKKMSPNIRIATILEDEALKNLEPEELEKITTFAKDLIIWLRNRELTFNAAKALLTLTKVYLGDERL